MGKSLVIAEKPSVGKEIAKIMGARPSGEGYCEGGRYVVTWALGHLVTLADPEEYGEQYKTWSLDTLPMLPKDMKLVVIKQTSKQYGIVQKLLRRSDISDVVIATDAGREGELVARWILQKSNCRKPILRLWISSQTSKAIREGFASLKPGVQYEGLYRSAVARAEADWVVGFNVTRALTCKFGAQLSGGRVQTPTLALLAAREKEIREFEPQEYYTLRLKCGGFDATWADARGNCRIFNREKAEALTKSLHGKPAIATEVRKQYKQKPPPAAYDLTELQRDANRKYAYSAQETLNIMQSLYERHKLLTYPRTDSRYITSDVAATLTDRLRSIAVGPYKEQANALLRSRPLKTKYIVNEAKVTDHHAIIPTEEPVNLEALSGEETRIYDLAVRRFLAVLSEPYSYEETALIISVGREKFKAKGQIVQSPGWKSAYDKTAVIADEDEDEDEDEGERVQILPMIKQGDRFDTKDLMLKTALTQPPGRYTEATLLSVMEKANLGTVATRADIIEKLFSAFYMERSGKQLSPTSKGIQLIEIVPGDLRSAELTANWERRLQAISRGEEDAARFAADMRKFASKLVADVKASSAIYRHDNQTKDKCPDCGKNLLAVKGKKGNMLVCPDRDCGYRKSVSILTNARCPNCHKKLELRGEGEKRLFTCICGHRERYADFEKRRVSDGASKRDVQKFLDNQKKSMGGSTAMADALAKWLEQQI